MTLLEIEGDGPLGLIIGAQNGDIIVERINPNTVCSEFFELKPKLKIVKVNNISVVGMRFVEVLKMLNSIWRKEGKISIEISNDYIETNCPIYKFLNDHDSLEYYDNFVELGAKTLDDLEYIEYVDLTKMNMKSENIAKICMTLNIKISIPKKSSEVFSEI